LAEVLESLAESLQFDIDASSRAKKAPYGARSLIRCKLTRAPPTLHTCIKKLRVIKTHAERGGT